MSTEMAESTAGAQFLVPSNFAEAIKVADMLAKSDLVPKDYRGKPANVVVAIGWGAEVGLKPLQSLQNIAVINGRGSIWGDAALALCMRAPNFEDVVEKIEGEGEAMVAVCTAKRKGREPVVRRFSVADAKVANLWGVNTWKQYPKRMLQMRARGFALRDCFPDALRGLYLVEELQDMPAEPKDITNAPGAGQVKDEPEVPKIDADKVVQEIQGINTEEALRESWKKWADQCQAENNLDAYKTIKEACAARAAEIKEQAKQPAETAPE